ncbi:hypothetical protein TREES_T100002465 [Tupaia chinensis]|uniref:Uncharacterized protein n=1 Tax=Tupaia chinensis TaxID=246437 RepID=L9LAG0_TUPCH|nr:hypothetical protein TREES_T100002465 [Tupaia chinensis]
MDRSPAGSLSGEENSRTEDKGASEAITRKTDQRACVLGLAVCIATGAVQ